MGLISITSLLLHEILFIFPVHSMISYNFAEDTNQCSGKTLLRFVTHDLTLFVHQN